MTDRPADAARRRAWVALLLAYAVVGALLAGAFFLDIHVAGVRPINKRPPAFAPVDMLRTAMMLAAAATAVFGTIAAGRRAARGAR